MRHARYVALVIALFLGGGCASLGSGTTVSDETAAPAEEKFRQIIDAVFTPPVARELQNVKVSFQKDLYAPFTGRKVNGYYNPFTNRVTMELVPAVLNQETVGHEMLHAWWFQQSSRQQRLAFIQDTKEVFADPEYRWLADRIIGNLNGHHWLNRLFAYWTEVHSEISEEIITNPFGKNVSGSDGVFIRTEVIPEKIRHHYRGILKALDNVPTDYTHSSSATPPPDSPP